MEISDIGHSILNLDWSILCSLVLLLIASGYWHSQGIHSDRSYLVSGRSTGFFALTATLVMTEFNTTTLVAFSGLAYLAGLRALYLPAVFLVGLLFYALTVAKKWKEYDGLSVAGFLAQRYGSTFGKAASISLLVAMAGFSASYVKALILIVSPLFPSASPWLLSALLLLLIMSSIGRGGLPAIVRIDIVSFILMGLCLPWLAFWGPTASASIPIAESASETLPSSFLGSLMILTMFTYILAPWYGQKIFAARTEKTAIAAVIAAALLVFLLYSCGVIATARLKSLVPSLEHQESLPYLVYQLLPTGLRGAAIFVLFAAAATTLAGVWSAMTSMVVGDFLGGSLDKGCQRSILITLIWGICSWILANTLVDDILNKMILANIPVFALSFSVLAGFYWPRASQAGAVLSTAVGLLWGIGCYLLLGEVGSYTVYWAFGGLPLIFGAGIAGSLFIPAQPR